MRTFSILVTLLLTLSGISLAQPQLQESRGKEPEKDIPEKMAPQDTVIKSHILTWKLSDDFSQKVTVELDTQTIGFHKYDPVYRLSISNTHLGHVGAPYQSNIYFDRPDGHNFYFTRHLKAFAPLASETPYYSSTLSFSSLTYVQDLSSFGGPEQAFDAFMIRNIDPKTNIGFRFHVNVTEPEYNLLEANHRSFNFFVSRNTERYNGYFSLVNGSNEIGENGGISGTRIYGRPKSMQVNLILGNGLNNYNKTFSAFTSHEYFLGETITEMDKDSVVSKKFIPWISAQYTAEWENDQRNLTESSVDVNFFDSTYISNKSNHVDSIFYTRFSHTFQLKILESSKRKYTFGKRAFISNEIVTATHPVPYGYRKYAYSNVTIGASIYRSESKLWKWDATGKLVLLGRNLGDAQVKGRIEKLFRLKNDSIFLNLEGWYRDQSADIFQDHLVSNHFKWENDFTKQHDVTFKGKIDYPRIRASAGINYALLSNYLYNNAEGCPNQYHHEFSVFSVWLKKDFSFWRFGWNNHIVWQELSDNSVLRLPTLSAYSAFYYSHFLFKVMQIQLGAEVYYNTPFKAESYNPATTQFFVQDDTEIGGFPVVNAFVNAKLKRTSAFFKVTHANSMVNGTQFFMAPGYPMGQMVMRFGFLWSFYD